MINQKTGRKKLATVLQRAGDLISVEDATVALGVSRQIAAKTLWRWNRQGWLKHLRRGLYAQVPLDSVSQKQVLPEPWILVPEIFNPGYIGGWSAAEQWDLTEQIFRSVLVFTARPIWPQEQTIQGICFVLRRIKPENLFGMRTVWRANVKVQVSDASRTLVDMLNVPSVGGGIRHVSSCLQNFLESKGDMQKIFEYADRLGNGAVFKRLGFLISLTDADDKLLDSCRSRLTTGNAKLDPAIPCRRLIKKWRLWIPKIWEKEFASD